jgi:hypothetical protein
MSNFRKGKKNAETLSNKLKDFEVMANRVQDTIDNAAENLLVWHDLEDEFEQGEEVFEPSPVRKKRARSPGHDDEDWLPMKIRTRAANQGERTPEPYLVDELDLTADEFTVIEPLTLHKISTKIAELKAQEKAARHQKVETKKQIRELEEELALLKLEITKLENDKRAQCIVERNNYSALAIKRDFASGVRDVDHEIAEEEDEDSFNPTRATRDYDEVAERLPVFCISSRAYQQQKGRQQQEAKIVGFHHPEDTQIPQLQAHCKTLTRVNHESHQRMFLTMLSQLFNSIVLWATRASTTVSLEDKEAAETCCAWM